MSVAAEMPDKLEVTGTALIDATGGGEGPASDTEVLFWLGLMVFIAVFLALILSRALRGGGE